jgi:hypothetical protein
MFQGMDGKGRFGVLAVASSDPVMSLLGPIGLAAAAGTALVVDMGRGVRIPPRRTLADIATDGPRLAELAPGRRGVAFVSAHGLAAGQVAELVGRLSMHWPAVVIRIGDSAWEGPTVPLIPLYPGWLAPDHEGAAVWQSMPGGSRPPGPGPVLPNPGRVMIARVLGGGLPRRDRWVRAWLQAWEMPWA